jgi:hypothetical protein
MWRDTRYGLALQEPAIGTCDTSWFSKLPQQQQSHRNCEIRVERGSHRTLACEVIGISNADEMTNEIAQDV